MRKATFTAPTLAMLMAAALAFLSPSTPAAALDGQKLFEEKCTMCHEDRTGEVENPDEAKWREVVDSMQKYASGLISDDEAAAIVKYLTENKSK